MEPNRWKLLIDRHDQNIVWPTQMFNVNVAINQH